MTIVRRKSSYGVKVWDRGQQRYVWVGSFATRAEAVRAERDATTTRVKETPTVEQWGRVWLSDYARQAPATQRTYRYAVEQIAKTLGKHKLSEIGRPDARRIANGWPRATARVARTMWADAVRDGICDINPWTNLRLETPKGRKDIDALTEQEIAELADLAAVLSGDYGTEARAIILTLAYTGMRPGELCALRRADVDLEANEVVVQRSLDGTGREKTPKNGLSRRIILPREAADAIRLVPRRVGSPYLFHTRSRPPAYQGDTCLPLAQRASGLGRKGRTTDRPLRATPCLRHDARRTRIERRRRGVPARTSGRRTAGDDAVWAPWGGCDQGSAEDGARTAP
jgi:integrase